MASSKFLVYAITEAGLEIYTTRGVAAALHEILRFDNVSNVCILESLWFSTHLFQQSTTNACDFWKVGNMFVGNGEKTRG